MLIALMATVLSAARPAPLAGNWVLHLYLGDHVFDDEVQVAPQADGALGGTLKVPGRFTAPLENVRSDAAAPTLSFEITADEGHGPFRVRYEGSMHTGNDTFVGFATMLGDRSLLGGFVAQRRP